MNVEFNKSNTCCLCSAHALVTVTGRVYKRSFCKGCWGELRDVFCVLGPIEAKNAGQKGREDL
jgi:hypothetical protein